MGLDDVKLAGVALVVLIPLLIQLAKSLGLPAQLWGAATLVISLVCTALVQLVAHYPELHDWVWVLVAGVVLATASTGAYELAKPHVQRIAGRGSDGAGL